MMKHQDYMGVAVINSKVEIIKITQDIFTKHMKSMYAGSSKYYKPELTNCIIVTDENVEQVNSACRVKSDPEYDSIVLGSLDGVVGYSKVAVGTGVMLSIDGNGNLDAYPNPEILNPAKYKKVDHVEVQGLSLLLPDSLLNIMSSYAKVISVNMISVLDFKRILGFERILAIEIEATWGIQSDVRNHDFIVLDEGNSYKVDLDQNTNLPEKYVRLG